jgi:carboxylesterase type B
VLAARPATLYVFAPILDGDFIRQRPVEALKSGNFAHVPVLFGFNSNEGSKWSARLPDPSANTSMPNATEATVFNFLRGQYASLGQALFNDAVKLYPLKDYANSFSLQGQQMYGECRYICTAPMITGAAITKSNNVFQYQ